MNKKPLLLSLLGLWLCALGCQSPPPEPLDSAQVQWETYSNSDLGYTLTVPSAYTLDEYSNGHFVIFRHKGSPAVRVNFTDMAEEKNAACGLATPPLTRSN